MKLRSSSGSSLNMVLVLTSAAVALVLLCIASAVTVNVLSATSAQNSASNETDFNASPGLITNAPSAYLTVIGDSYVDTAAPDVSARDRWTSLLASRLKLRPVLLASDRSGFLVSGDDGRTLIEQASSVSSASSVVVLAGGLVDNGSSKADLSKAVSTSITLIRSKAPNAKVLVVGPFSSSGLTTRRLQVVESALKSAAKGGRVEYVSPLSSMWLKRGAGRVFSPDDLTAEDERGIYLGMLRTLT